MTRAHDNQLGAEFRPLGRILTFGRPERLLAAVDQDVIAQARPLRISNIFRLKPEDVILSPLPWSPLLDWIQSRPSGKRPYIVRVADGFITQINSRKRINRHDGGLYANVNGDCFVILQNEKDMTYVMARSYPFHAARKIDLVERQIAVSDLRSALFVFGNDPRLDVPEAAIIEALEAAIEFCSAHGISILGASVPETRFRRQLQRRFPNVQFVRLARDIDADTRGALIITSPSTVALDYLLRGEAVLMLSCYPDPVAQSYFAMAHSLEEVGRSGFLMAWSPRRYEERRLNMNALAALILTFPKRRVPARLALRAPGFSAVRDIVLLLRPH
ncbi:hypothetical protein ACN2C7_06455 [Caulobacter sp. ErkDOM-E]|uniref:hypothetical protein n=1 Tax=Caulobacter sp. ErkDOM-E TaxID=3402778 RepID=UPI003AF7FFD3